MPAGQALAIDTILIVEDDVFISMDAADADERHVVRHADAERGQAARGEGRPAGRTEARRVRPALGASGAAATGRRLSSPRPPAA